MSEIKYQHAFINNNRDRIISIDEITNQNRKQYKYYCIGCGNELLPRAIDSKYRTPHFYHREVVNCSGETYLHKLTKHVLKQKFDNEATFFVKYNVTKECSNTNCKYRNPRCREERVPNKIDLKRDYDTCTEEATINGYIADLLLTNSKNPKIEPILIEVCVSHPCDKDKRNSGLQIIEIKIKEEQDIINLQREEILREHKFASNRESKIEFLSFKRDIIVPPHVKIQRYIYNPQQNPVGYLTEIDCTKANERLRTNSLLELNVIDTMPYKQCKMREILQWMSAHKGLRRCNLCKFYYATEYEDYPICRLSKKYGKPAYPNMDEAERCNSYRQQEVGMDYYNPNDYIIEEVASQSIPMKPEYKVILAVSRSFINYELYREKILFYLSDIMKTYSVVIITGASEVTDIFTDKLCEEINFIKEPHKANWGKYEQDASRVLNDEMTNCADALIAFWDGRSPGTENLIELAKQKSIKVAVVKC